MRSSVLSLLLDAFLSSHRILYTHTHTTSCLPLIHELGQLGSYNRTTHSQQQKMASVMPLNGYDLHPYITLYILPAYNDTSLFTRRMAPIACS